MRYEFSPELDSARLEELYMGDPGIALEVFAAFVEETGPIIPGIETLFREGDQPGFRALVHKIKPGFLYVGLTALFESLSELEAKSESVESLAKIGDEYRDVLARINEKLPLIERELERLRSYSEVGA